MLRRALVGLLVCGLTSVMELILAASLVSGRRLAAVTDKGFWHSAFLRRPLKALPSPAHT